MAKLSLVILCVLLSYALGQSCSWTDPNTGQQYDLSPLKNDNQDYYIPKGSAPGVTWDIWLNMCRPVVKPDCGPQAAGCQRWDPNTGKASLGLVSSLTFQTAQAPGDGGFGVTAQFTGGDGGRQMELDFKCKQSGSTGAPVFSSENPKLHYNFVWESVYACPVSASEGGLTGGGIIMIIVACLIFVYIVGGIIFNAVIRKQRGIEMFPNVTFWVTVPGLVKDGFVFVINKTVRRGGYQQVK